MKDGRTLWTMLKLTFSPTARDAQAHYFAAQDRAASRVEKLEQVDKPDERMMLLYHLGRDEHDMATHHIKGWGHEWYDDDGMSAHQSMLWSACLLRLLADVEKAVAYPQYGRRETTTDLERAAGEVLDKMAATPDLVERMAYLPTLYAVVLDKVGGQAAETVATVRYPGRPDDLFALVEADQ